MCEPYSEVIVAKDVKLESNMNMSQVKKPVVDSKLDSNIARIIKSADGLSNSIINIWAQSLGVKEISFQDNFFDLNGDSFLAVEICYQISTENNIHISPNILLEYPVLKDFIAAVPHHAK